jgi:ribosome-associated protein
VQDAVHVEQNRGHERGLYSRHALGRAAAGGGRAAGLSLERAGGQHAQKSETRVVAVFDVESSTALTGTQKRRVISRTGPVLRAVAQDERSQSRNRELALERLVAALREALRVERKRVPTKPTAAARERRLEQKKRRSQTKQLRRRLD